MEEDEGESSKERTTAVSSGVMKVFGGQDFSMLFSVWGETVPVVSIDCILTDSSRGSSVHLLISFL